MADIRQIMETAPEDWAGAMADLGEDEIREVLGDCPPWYAQKVIDARRRTTPPSGDDIIGDLAREMNAGLTNPEEIIDYLNRAGRPTVEKYGGVLPWADTLPSFDDASWLMAEWASQAPGAGGGRPLVAELMDPFTGRPATAVAPVAPVSGDLFAGVPPAGESSEEPSGAMLMDPFTGGVAQVPGLRGRRQRPGA